MWLTNTTYEVASTPRVLFRKRGSSEPLQLVSFKTGPGDSWVTNLPSYKREDNTSEMSQHEAASTHRGSPRKIPRKEEVEHMLPILYTPSDREGVITQHLDVPFGCVLYSHSVTDPECPETKWEKYKVTCKVGEKKKFIATLWKTEIYKGVEWKSLLEESIFLNRRSKYKIVKPQYMQRVEENTEEQQLVRVTEFEETQNESNKSAEELETGNSEEEVFSSPQEGASPAETAHKSREQPTAPLDDGRKIAYDTLVKQKSGEINDLRKKLQKKEDENRANIEAHNNRTAEMRKDYTSLLEEKENAEQELKKQKETTKKHQRDLELCYKNIEALQEELGAEKANKDEILAEYQESINKLNLANLHNQECIENHNRKSLANQLEDKAKITEQAVKIDQLQHKLGQVENAVVILDREKTQAEQALAEEQAKHETEKTKVDNKIKGLLQDVKVQQELISDMQSERITLAENKASIDREREQLAQIRNNYNTAENMHKDKLQAAENKLREKEQDLLDYNKVLEELQAAKEIMNKQKDEIIDLKRQLQNAPPQDFYDEDTGHQETNNIQQRKYLQVGGTQSVSFNPSAGFVFRDEEANQPGRLTSNHFTGSNQRSEPQTTAVLSRSGSPLAFNQVAPTGRHNLGMPPRCSTTNNAGASVNAPMATVSGASCNEPMIQNFGAPFQAPMMNNAGTALNEPLANNPGPSFNAPLMDNYGQSANVLSSRNQGVQLNSLRNDYGLGNQHMTQPQSNVIEQNDLLSKLVTGLITGVKETLTEEKKDEVTEYYTFYGTPNTISVHDWLSRIESQFKDSWDEVRKVQFATRRLDTNNPDLKSRARLDCPTFKHFKEYMILTFGSDEQPFTLSEWNEARRYQGTSFRNWTLSPKGARLIDETAPRWDARDARSLTKDERAMVMNKLKAMVPLKFFAPYVSPDGDWDHDELKSLTFMRLMAKIKFDEQYWYDPVWKSFQLPFPNRNSKNYVINSLEQDREKANPRFQNYQAQVNSQSRQKEAKGRNSPTQDNKPKYNKDQRFSNSKNQSSYNDQKSYNNNRDRGGSNAENSQQKQSQQQNSGYQNYNQRNQGQQQRQYQQSRQANPPAQQNNQNRDFNYYNRGGNQGRPSNFRRGNGRGRGYNPNRNQNSGVNTMGYGYQDEQPTHTFYNQQNQVQDRNQNQYQLPTPLQQQERQQFQRQQGNNQTQYQQPAQQEQYPRGISQSQAVRPKNWQGAPAQEQGQHSVGVIQSFGNNQHH